MTEDQIQQQIFTFYNNNYCLKNHNPRHIIFSVPNGGSRNILEAKKMKLTGTLAGVSDLIIIKPNQTIFVEVKTLKGTQRDVQIDFQKRVELLGFQYLLVRSLEDFKNKITNEKI